MSATALAEVVMELWQDDEDFTIDVRHIPDRFFNKHFFFAFRERIEKERPDLIAKLPEINWKTRSIAQLRQLKAFIAVMDTRKARELLSSHTGESEMAKSKEPKHVGTWVIGIELTEFTKWGLDGDTKFPYPPDDKAALEQAKYLATNDSIDDIALLHVFDNGQIKTIEFDPTEHGIEPQTDDPRPEFPEGTPWNHYSIEALEKFLVTTEYIDVKARSHEEAEWLCRNGVVSYDNKVIEEGEDEWVAAKSIELTEENVGEPEDEE